MISPLGIGNDATWQGLVDGRSGIGRITKFDASAFPCQIAGEVRGFEAEKWIEKKEVKKSDTFIHYAVAAAQMAIDDSGIDTKKEDSDRIGVIIGSGIGGLPLIEEMHRKLLERGPSRISPFFIPGLIVNLASGQVSIRFNAQGPNSAPATACATGAHAIGDACRVIRYGDADVMFAGGSEAVITPPAVGDKTETIAIKRVFGDHAYKLAISSTKSMTGHLLGAAGGLESAITALAVKTGIVPPTINYEFPDPECDLDYVPNAKREMKLEHAMSNSFGFGGTNATLIFTAHE